MLDEAAGEDETPAETEESRGLSLRRDFETRDTITRRGITMNRALWALGIVAVVTAQAWSASPAAPTFQELMDPKLFPKPQRGMIVESAALDGDSIRVRTTGADIRISLSTGQIVFGQRIGHQRPLAVARIPGKLSGARLTHKGPGLARITFDKPKMTIRINGDSLLMLHVHEPLTVPIDSKIAPAWNASFENCHLIADEWGALGLYCSDLKAKDRWDVYNQPIASYSLPRDAVLWVGVCPPKPYDWKRSLNDNVVWHWSRETSYPTNDVLRSWKPHGNTVLLQSEVMLWKDWNIDFVPRLGLDEFARVRKTLHDQGQRFIVYTSPYYFLKGTALENRAMNSFKNFKNWPPGTPTGENMGLFLPAIRKVMRDYKPDGLYFDGQYIRNPAALYALARESRSIIGEDGILEWHSTWALGSQHCYLPHADAYVDFVLRGEGRGTIYGNVDYLRFFVSGYNIHNSIGVLCNNGKIGVTSKMARDALSVNARLHTIVSWLDNAKIMGILESEYKSKLTPELRRTVDADVDRRQARVAQKAAAMRNELNALRNEPKWGKPVFVESFENLPSGKQAVSAKNPNPFSIVNGILRVRGHANTYAFIRIPLKITATGLVVKIRQGSGGGQSWGPGVMLRWPGGKGLRLGTRSDAKLQADVLGTQYHGKVYDTSKWVWLRARWGQRCGVIERSDDGKDYAPAWRFEHGGVLTGKTAELLVGKVPYNGEPKDHPTPGKLGQCDIDSVEVYAD